MAELKWGAGTHPGQIRPQNEDNLYVDAGIFVVADGMGGHEAGEVASQLAVERIRELLEGSDRLRADQVVEAISSANGDIFRAAIANPDQAGMGTTVTAIAVVEDPMAGRGAPNIDDNDPIDTDPDGNPRVTPVTPQELPEALVLANVGDSRTYLFRHDRLRRITVDHSYVQELVATGHITDDEARHHPRRNIITRALGIEPDVKVDWWTLPIIRGDRFVLCSDGLVDEVADDDISNILRSNPDPQKAADTLIASANEAGGRDNVTVVVVDVLEGDDPPDPTQELDLVPSWAEDGEAAALSGDGVIADPALVLSTDAADDEAAIEAGDVDSADDGQPTSKRRSRLGRWIAAFVVLAVLVAAAVAVGAWARRGYFVEFDSDGDVTVYQGRPGGFLWIDPTAEVGGPNRDDLSDDSIDAVDDQPTFSSLGDAKVFVSELEFADAGSDDETEPGDDDAVDGSDESDTAGNAGTEPTDPADTSTDGG